MTHIYLLTSYEILNNYIYNKNKLKYCTQ